MPQNTAADANSVDIGAIGTIKIFNDELFIMRKNTRMDTGYAVEGN